jgi:hypothetical protein
VERVAVVLGEVVVDVWLATELVDPLHDFVAGSCAETGEERHVFSENISERGFLELV